jgi:hypothetical protein
MSTPLTQALARRARFSEVRWTATQVGKPVIALIGTKRHLGVLLAKDARPTRRGTMLRGVRWVRIPQGWRLRFLQLRARLGPAHLPDEWLFNSVYLEQIGDMYVPRLRSGEALAPPSELPFPIKSISPDRHDYLLAAPGRELLTQVQSIFGRHARGTAPFMSPLHAWFARPSPYPLFEPR